MDELKRTAESFTRREAGRVALWAICNLVSIAGALQFAHYARMGNNRMGIRMAVLCIAANRLAELFKKRTQKQTAEEDHGFI